MSNCAHCGQDKSIRNPSGFCDHLYYPDYCETCKKLAKQPQALYTDFPPPVDGFCQHGFWVDDAPGCVYCLFGEEVVNGNCPECKASTWHLRLSRCIACGHEHPYEPGIIGRPVETPGLVEWIEGFLKEWETVIPIAVAATLSQEADAFSRGEFNVFQARNQTPSLSGKEVL